MKASAYRYDPETLPIAIVGRTHGVRGELRVHPFNPNSQALLGPPTPFTVALEPGKPGPVKWMTVGTLRAAHDYILLQFAAITDRDVAASLTGSTLRMRRSDLPPLAAGEYYVEDLVGCSASAVDGPPGVVIGTVTAIFSNGAQSVLTISRPKGEELMVPMVPEHLREVDIRGRKITVVVLESAEVVDAEPRIRV
ncbi:MAG: ribosome maturation factor RimM [Deltaproteobacteria bacterium]|nr:ribosome maturation factor RimM [Deltaproteobacteria bacterium]